MRARCHRRWASLLRRFGVTGTIIVCTSALALAGSPQLHKLLHHNGARPAHSCAIGNVQIVGVSTAKVVSTLWDRWRIIATPIVHAEYEGLRVTPNVYTTLAEIDTFVEAMQDAAKNGVPAPGGGRGRSGH